ncbi:MAG: 5,10-methylenetetrahydrofolate reductase [Candidatus Heimdallarchaeota archaeon LC_3]|nr:MAG: 5,10-methylenetetrahydrofolate reductase [Candidatus Heimdallarchaeota archaeon LC_3]
MKIHEYIKDHQGEPFISFELIPPKRGARYRDIEERIEILSRFNPPFIDVTTHASEIIYQESKSGIKKLFKKKRPGTHGICAIIQHKFGIEAVPHILCRGFTREETEDLCIDLHYLGINNVLAVQGDERGYEPPYVNGGHNRYANELVSQINNLKEGIYLDEDSLNEETFDFCIGVGAYPEKHYEAPNMEYDLQFLKQKIDAGACYMVTQMFYDNQAFKSFVKQASDFGINAPIIPGLKVFTSKKQLNSLPKIFHINIPPELTKRTMKANDSNILDIGIKWAVEQCKDLLEFGVPGIHFYVLENASVVAKVIDQLKDKKLI